MIILSEISKNIILVFDYVIWNIKISILDIFDISDNIDDYVIWNIKKYHISIMIILSEISKYQISRWLCYLKYQKISY